MRKLYPPAKIGIIGGGQLGRMIAREAKRMGYYVVVLDPTPAAPAGQVADTQITADFQDESAIRKLAESCDVLTYEFEHISADILIALEQEGYHICPSGRSLKTIKDKFTQKNMLKSAGLPVPEFMAVSSVEDMHASAVRLGLPFILKTRFGGYDGKGNCVVRAENELEQAYAGFSQYSLMAERFVDFERELSIMVARSAGGELVFYPVAENVHEESILRITRAPACISKDVETKVKEIAAGFVEALDDCGIFCIEMFLDRNGAISINEVAPRPHNSAHYTIEACATSQYEQLVRVLTGMPLGSPKQRFPSVMVNILGSSAVKGRYCVEGIEGVLGTQGAYLHLYGKALTHDKKKIGHITVLDESLEAAEHKALEALEKLIIKPLEV